MGNQRKAISDAPEEVSREQPAEHARPSVLIVDDDQVMRLLERETLTRFDFEVSEAIDGQSALDMLASAIPSLVLLDVEMAGLDGFQVCRRIRENWDATDLPIVMVTGMDDLRSINQAYMAGANDFIAKPINWPMLGHRARYVVRSAQAARRLRALEEKQAAITRAIPDMIFVHDAQGRYLDFKPAFGQQPFVPPEDFLGKHLTSVLPTDAAEVIQHGIERALGRQGLQAVNYKLPMPDGLHHYEARIAPSGENQVVIVVRDITLQKLNEEKVRRLAYFDALTGMPNRLGFLERLEGELLRARRSSRPLALLFLDLDDFKRINDTLGHNAGDYLLQAVADRLKQKLRPGDFVSRPALDQFGAQFARLGGDEFTVVLPGVDDTQVITPIAERMLALLSRPFVISDQEITVTSSIGIATFPEDGDDAASLLKHADTAMNHAKAQGRNNWQKYSKALTNQAMTRLALENDMRKGLERDEFCLFYQPQIRATDGAVVGVEALIRWRHPEHGLVSPIDFIPVAEESGLIVPMGEWVIRKACLQAMQWQQRGVPAPRIAVNVSARQLRGSDFIGRVAAIVAQTGISPECLELELTESILMHAEVRRVEGLLRLKALGVHFAIDDFGTGYSSLSYVKRFPIGMLKIDQSFIRGLPHNANDAGITTAIVAMAHSLGLEVIAEGVETQAQVEFLRHAGCHKMQGYLFSRPLPEGEIERVLQAGGMALA